MARSRNIKPAFFENDLLAECSPLARLLFVGLWCIADRNGVLEDRPRRIKAQVLPYDDCNAIDLLAELIDRDFVRRLEKDGMDFLWVVNFKQHQNPHKNEDAKHFDPNSEVIAPKSEDSGSTTRAVPDEHPSDRADSLLRKPDSLLMNDERGTLESDGVSEAPSSTPDDVLEAFNRAFGRNARMTDSRRKTINTRLKDTWWRENWMAAIDKGKGLPFMQGNGDRGWRASIDFFIKPDSATQILEGKYDGKAKANQTSRGQTSGAREFAATSLD